MEATLDRGRWSSARVARIYVNDGLAREVERIFSPAARRRLSVLPPMVENNGNHNESRWRHATQQRHPVSMLGRALLQCVSVYAVALDHERFLLSK